MPSGWRKPPPGIPRKCWNIYAQKYKYRFHSREEALEKAKNSDHVYQCTHCRYHHIGRPSLREHSFEIGRRDDLVAELGIRVVAHLMQGDTESAIKKRYLTVRNLVGLGRRKRLL